jgi:phosphoribosylaminoimidazole-succinocarboxamide synthase
MSTIPKYGTKIIEGKTKQVLSLGMISGILQAQIISGDAITAGDGAKRDILPGKGVLANQTTCNVFSILKKYGIPVAFEEQIDDDSFRAPLCTMFPYEVVVRREAHGSYLKRMPSLPKGHYFPELLLEFFLKTNDRRWKSFDLPCDDPLIQFLWDVDEKLIHEVRLFDPAKPIATQAPFLNLSPKEVFSRNDESAMIKKMGMIAKQTFLILEDCWQSLGGKLVDFKVEFGVNSEGELLLADVIDNDSWRVIENGAYIDKQVYRDGGALEKVLENYARVAALTAWFKLPK